MIVAIDGPAGAGKSTVATEVARRLGFAYLDTGAMYRAVALAALEEGVDPEDAHAVGDLARGLEIDVHDGRISLGGRDVTDDIRKPAVTAVVSVVSASPQVRDALVAYQRRRAVEGGIVVEGRDIGTVVFPDAEVKIFMTASLEERARRRSRQGGDAGRGEIGAVMESIRARDEADRGRDESPLARAADATLLDTTRMSFDEVVDAVVRAARAAGAS